MKSEEFQKIIWDFYQKNKRDFPWRETTDPYKIMVSELMLQQTQTHRVLPKYEAFMNRFPTIKELAAASLSDVLELWIGLGYNRRAKFLHQAAIIISQNNSLFPQDPKELQKIPGIGPYTASAILVFAYNKPLLFIETNIRRVYIHHFFKDTEKISDKELFPLIEQTIDNKNPREWYYALMDYGSYLAKIIQNPNRKSTKYIKQSKFEGSIRKVRGEILRQLLTIKKLNKTQLKRILTAEPEEKINSALDGLQKDNIIENKNGYYLLK